MFRKILFATALLAVLAIAPASAGVTGTVEGGVISVTFIYSGGQLNKISIITDTWDGWFWEVLCTRADGNLGLCNGVVAGDSIEAYGDLFHTGTFGACNYPDLYPITLSVY